MIPFILCYFYYYILFFWLFSFVYGCRAEEKRTHFGVFFARFFPLLLFYRVVFCLHCLHAACLSQCNVCFFRAKDRAEVLLYLIVPHEIVQRVVNISVLTGIFTLLNADSALSANTMYCLCETCTCQRWKCSSRWKCRNLINKFAKCPFLFVIIFKLLDFHSASSSVLFHTSCSVHAFIFWFLFCPKTERMQITCICVKCIYIFPLFTFQFI